jgi:uncharacterized protein (TIGR03067 family)
MGWAVTSDLQALMIPAGSVRAVEWRPEVPMRMPVLVALWLGVALPAADPPRDYPAEKYRQRLQGSWKAVQQNPGDRLDWLRFRVETLTWKPGQGGSPTEGAYRVDLTKSPHEIDVTVPGGVTYRGIYELNAEPGGENMVLCLGGPGGERPRRFSAEHGAALVVLKHVPDTPNP